MFRCECEWKAGKFSEKQEELKASLCRLEYDIVEELYEVAREGYGNPGEKGKPASKWSTRGWTRRVKESLWYLGHRERCMVYPSIEGEEGEYPDMNDREDVRKWLRQRRDRKMKMQWLFDLCWVVAPYDDSKREFDWTRMRGMKLACECEWGRKRTDILEDFLKLTVVLADLRLFIYQNKKTIHSDEDPVELCKRARSLTKGSRYLLVGINGKQFRVDAWTA